MTRIVAISVFVLALTFQPQARADLAYVTSTATISISAVGASNPLATITGAIPFQGTELTLGPVAPAPAIFGVMGIHRLHNPTTGNIRVIIPSPSVGDLVQDSSVSTFGQVTMDATFSLTFTIDAGGLPAHTENMMFGFGGLLGNAPGSTINFNSTMTFTHSVSGFLGTYGVSFFRDWTTPGNFSPLGLNASNSLALAAMLPGTLTVTGNITMQVDDSSGDSGGELVTEFGVVAIPEPSTWALLAVTVGLAAGYLQRQRLARLSRRESWSGAD